MTWFALVELLLAFFGPIIAEWLKKLLDRAAAEAGRDLPASYYAGGIEAAGVEKLFDIALAEVPWYHFARRRVLKACRRQATARAGEFYGAMRLGREAPVMSAAEAKELADATGV